MIDLVELQAGDTEVEVDNVPILVLCLLAFSSALLGVLLAMKYREQIRQTFRSLSSLGSLGVGSSIWLESGDAADGSERVVKIEMNPIYDVPSIAPRVCAIGPYDVYSAADGDANIEN